MRDVEKSKKGIVCILLSAFCFSLMSLFIRLAGDVPTMQKCFFRNLVAMLIAIAALVKAHQPFQIGKGNLITSIEIAAAKHPDGTAVVPEVCIFFENHLLRGNRTTKINAENFNAFRSYNYPALATAGIHIKYEYDRIRKVDPNLPMHAHYVFDTNVIILTLFPGIQENIVRTVLNTPGLKAVVLKTYGSGNAPQKPWFIHLLAEATAKGIVIVNISQCQTGMVEMARYETGLHLLDAGVISGYDATVESVLTKLMFLLGHGLTPKEIRSEMNRSIAGEFTKPML